MLLTDCQENLFWILCKTFETGENFSGEAFTKLDLEIQRYLYPTFSIKSQHIHLKIWKYKKTLGKSQLICQKVHKIQQRDSCECQCVIWNVSIKVWD